MEAHRVTKERKGLHLIDGELFSCRLIIVALLAASIALQIEVPSCCELYNMCMELGVDRCTDLDGAPVAGLLCGIFPTPLSESLRRQPDWEWSMYYNDVCVFKTEVAAIRR